MANDVFCVTLEVILQQMIHKTLCAGLNIIIIFI